MEGNRPENPIVWFKDITGLTWIEVAILLELPRKYPEEHIRGYAKSLPKRTVKILKELGYPGDPEKDYQAFRESLAKELADIGKERIRRWEEYYLQKKPREDS